MSGCQTFITVNAVTSDGVVAVSADDFTPLAASAISSVCWWGAYSPAPVFNNNFTITIWIDTGVGFPEFVIASFSEGSTLSAVTQRDTGQIVAGVLPIFEYTASFLDALGDPTSVAVASGFCYWLEIKNTLIGTTWFWELSDEASGGNNQGAQDQSAPFDFADTGIFAFDTAWCLDIELDDPFLCGGIPTPDPPNNDLCAARRAIENGKTEYTTLGASTDGPPEPGCTAGPGPVNDIWFNYNADFTGDLQVTVCEQLNGSADFDTILVVYNGCDCDPLSPLLDCNDDDPVNDCGTGLGGFHSTISVPVIAGNCYKIRLGGFTGGDAGSGTLSLNKDVVPPQGPNNDDCADRRAAFNGQQDFTTVLATDDPADPSMDCGLGGSDVWFNYSADFTGTLIVDTCRDTNFDTVLEVFDGCACPPTTLLACNDDDCGVQSAVAVPVIAGNCYKIRIGGFAGGTGSGTLTLTKEGAPEPCSPGGVENNCCADRTLVFNGENEFSTVGATTDGSAHPECQFDGQTYNDIWFNYNSDFTGDLIVSTCNRVDYDSDLVVYDGCDCGALNLLGCNDDAGGCAGFSSEVTVPVVAGNCYKIRVGGFLEPDQGSGLLNITKVEPVQGDLCEGRRDIFNGKTEFSTEGAGTDGPGVPCTPIGPVNDIWFNYNSDFTGDLQVTTCEELNGSADFDTVLVVYDGCSCDPLAPILGCNDDDPNNPCGSGAGGFHSTVSVPVTAGNCYKIRLGGFSGGSSGTGVLDLSGRPTGPGPLDIKPGSCPNPLNCRSNGRVPIALVGTDSLDVTQVDLSSLQLSRKDGGGGSVAPNDGPPGPGFSIDDVATPFDGDAQDPDPSACCHAENGDGVDDLLMHFNTAEMCSVLGLDAFDGGTVFTLVLTGTLVDGTEFSAEDCMVIVPVGGAGAPLLSVGSNVPNVWIDVTPKDDAVDGGGFTPFVRFYGDGPPAVDNSPSATMVTLTAPASHEGKLFLGWSLGLGAGKGTGLTTGHGQLVLGTTLTVPVWTVASVEAIYGYAPPTAGGRR